VDARILDQEPEAPMITPAGTILAPNDIAILRILQQNLGRRPITWSVSAGRDFLGLEPYLVQQGLVFTIMPTLPDSTDPRYAPRNLSGLLLDIPATTRMVDQVYRYSGMDSMPTRPALDPAAEGIAANLANPVILLAVAMEAKGDPATALRLIETAMRIRPDESLRAAALQMRQRTLEAGTPPVTRP